MPDNIIASPDATGLGNEPQKSWPTISARMGGTPAIDLLQPGSELHTKVLTYLLDRIKMSERAMGRFYDRWRINEAKVQAYINLPDYEKQLKQMNDKNEAPKVVSIVVPYSFATIATIVTYMIHTFAGRKPMFQVSSYKSEAVEAAAKMEILLQYNSDHTRLIKHLFQYFNDGEIYGVGILRTQWRKETALRTVWKDKPSMLFGLFPSGSEKVKVRETRITYEGNDVSAVDPFMFFPDPRVPMHEVNKRGEFVFWRSYEGKHTLKREEAAGRIKYVDKISQTPPRQYDSETNGESARSLLSGGSATPGLHEDLGQSQKNFYQLDQGTVEIIPAELGLGDSRVPEKWIFTIANKSQIIQAEKLDLDHNMHPVAVIEPYTMGYGFGQAGMSDYLGPLQDTISWFVNSHIYNVRSALNNMLIVDPSMIEMQDLKNPEPGKIIRLKRAAYGQDVRAALNQLGIQDVTQGHVRDLQMFMKMGDSLSSITDNLRGIQDSGGRKTATEVRTGAEAAASRLAAGARLRSAQGMVDLTEQMCLNLQQNLSEEFYLAVVGEEGREVPIHISPEMLVGDFYYPVHDGTLPLDRVAMLDVWKEIFLAVAQDQELRGQFQLPKIFEFIAELGGARNIDRFKMQVDTQAPEQIAQQVQKGNMVPLGGQSGAINALGGRSPADRMAGGL